jgi:predicted transcriptional regulator
MKSVLISIQPKWCELIASGKKTVEVRKTKPKLETPFKVYIYCTQDKNFNFCTDNGEQYTHIGNGKVIGEFVCDKFYDIIQYGFGAKVFIDNLKIEVQPSEFIEMSCLSEEQIFEYIGNKDGYGWHISNLVIYDKPRELNEFVVEGDCLNGDCKKCKWFDGGNDYNVEADCLLPYDFHFKKAVKPLFRPPQSWCYVESEVYTE